MDFICTADVHSKHYEVSFLTESSVCCRIFPLVYIMHLISLI